MARELKIPRWWFHKGKYGKSHYDIPKGRIDEITKKCEVVSSRDILKIIKGIKNTLEDKYFYIKVKGEITNFKKHTSGHYYFSLKDNESMINVVMFKNSSEFCKVDLYDGLEIIASGKLTVQLL